MSPAISLPSQLLLASPSLAAVALMSLSGLPGRQGLGDALRSVCDPSTSSGFSSPLEPFASRGARLDWGPFLSGPGQLSCQLIMLFEAAAWPPSTFLSSPPHRVILILWISYLPTIIVLTHLLAHRYRLPWFPPLFGMIYQVASAALTWPLFLSFLILPTLLRCRPSRNLRPPFSRTTLRGVLLGLALGFFVPSFHLLLERDQSKRQSWTLAWQAFPVWVWVVERGWVAVGRTRHEGKAEKGWERWALRAVCGGCSIVGHVVVLSHLPNLLVLLPTLHTSPTHSLPELAHHTLTWDLIVAHTSVVFAVVYLASRSRSRSSSSGWSSAGRVVLGTLVGGLGNGVGLEALRWDRDEVHEIEKDN